MKIRAAAVLMGVIIMLQTAGCARFSPGNISSGADKDSVGAVHDYWPNNNATMGEKPMNIRVGLDGLTSTDDPVARVIENRLNITLTPVDVYEGDATYLDQLAAAGRLPDVFRVEIDAPYFIRWIEEGILHDLPPSIIDQYTRLKTIADSSDELQAFRRIYGQKLWFVPVTDAEPYLTADGGRLYYRKDWAASLGLAEPETLEEYRQMLEAFVKNEVAARPGASGLTLAGGVTYLMTLFGTDPESWIMENGQWIPAYYSSRMLDGLRFARGLYEDGLLDREYNITKANGAVNKLAGGLAGSLIRYGDAYWMERVLAAFAEENGITLREAYDNYIGVMPPPAILSDLPTDTAADIQALEDGEPASGTVSDINNGSQPESGEASTSEPTLRRYWARSVVTGACVVPATVSEEKLSRILSLLAYTLSEEGRELAFFGIRDETCAEGADGVLKLFIDPATARPFDIVRQYPAAQLLFILDRSRSRLGENESSIPSGLPPDIKTAVYDIAARYNEAAIEEGDGFMARFIHTPAKDALEAAINPGAAFNAIVAGTEPVEEMFALFQQECDEKNIRAAIEEVTARMETMTE